MAEDIVVTFGKPGIQSTMKSIVFEEHHCIVLMCGKIKEYNMKKCGLSKRECFPITNDSCLTKRVLSTLK